MRVYTYTNTYVLFCAYCYTQARIFNPKKKKEFSTQRRKEKKSQARIFILDHKIERTFRGRLREPKLKMT